MKNKNHMSQNEAPQIPIPAEVTANIAGVSPSLVKQVRAGKRNPNKGAGKKAAMADDLLHTGVNALVEAVKELVKL